MKCYSYQTLQTLSYLKLELNTLYLYPPFVCPNCDTINNLYTLKALDIGVNTISQY